MVAEAALKARLRQRVASTVDCFRDSAALLDFVDAVFQAPLTEAAAQDPAAWRVAVGDKLLVSRTTLREATQRLYAGLVALQAARIVERIAGTIEPVEPVVQHAMDRLQSACTYTLEAYESVEWCRAHLSSAAALLGGIGQAHGIPNAGALIDRERQYAYRDLHQAWERTVDALDEVVVALQML
jgi:hypothetical protein